MMSFGEAVKTCLFEKNMKIAYLLDLYSDVLDEHIGNVMRSYYEDDLSLSEIASDVGISRQGIRHLIKKGEEQIEFFEDKLGLEKLYSNLTSAKETLSNVYSCLKEREDLKELADEVKLAIEIISKGNQDVRESY